MGRRARRSFKLRMGCGTFEWLNGEKITQEVAAYYGQQVGLESTDTHAEVGLRKGHFEGGRTGKWMTSLSPLQIALIEFQSLHWLVDNGFSVSQPTAKRLAAALLGAPAMLTSRMLSQRVSGRSKVN